MNDRGWRQGWRGRKRRAGRQRTGAAGGVGVVHEGMDGQVGEGQRQDQRQCQAEQATASHHAVQLRCGGQARGMWGRGEHVLAGLGGGDDAIDTDAVCQAAVLGDGGLHVAGADVVADAQPFQQLAARVEQAADMMQSL